MSKSEHKDSLKQVALNRRARFDYEILDTFEAGLVLTGTEVKSLRQGKAQIAESYATIEGGEAWLINAYIPEYTQANRFNHAERRPRKLLLNKREIGKLMRAREANGLTIVPLKIFFNSRGIAKLNIALGRGKKNYDKRETEKKRDWQKQKARLVKDYG